jgi:Fe-S-cluster containining protein
MITTPLNLNESLPLTCSRKGTCCHGNLVFLNPWELVQLAKEKKISSKEFRDLFCEDGGIQLKFKGKQDVRGKSACNLYTDDFGCSVHKGRPLACRLFPIGRQIQSNEVQYVFQGTEFPCLNGCPEVLELPKLTVSKYLRGQETELFEQAQDEYLEVMQNLADIAFALLLDTELAESGDTNTLKNWRKMGAETPQQLMGRITPDWLDCLMVPEIDTNEPHLFIQQHNEILQTKAQQEFGSLATIEALSSACIQIMALTLYLAKGIGANPSSLVELWIEIAKDNGATNE